MRDAKGAVALLQQADIVYALTCSGRLGARHILVTLTDPIPPAAMARMARALRQRFPALDDGMLRNPWTGAIRPPLSPHRFSGRSEVVGDVAEALAALEDGNPPAAWRQLAEVVGIPLLTPAMERLLLDGDVEHRYRSRSEVVYAIALAHANAGSTEAHLLDDLLDAMNVAGEKVREMPHRRCIHYVRHSWRRACARAKRSPVIRNRPEALAQLERVRATVEAALWPGRAGATAWLILQAHLAVAECAGGPDYFASVRDIADLAGVTVRTVIRHHAHLLWSRWLRRRGLRYPGQATRWRLLSPCHDCHQSHPPTGGVRVW